MQLQTRSTLLSSVLVATLALSSCAGVRTSEDGTQATAYATSFNVLGLQFPFDDYAHAHSMVPEGATVNTAFAGPRDWTSVVGVLTALLGFSSTQVSYSLPG